MKHTDALKSFRQRLNIADINTLTPHIGVEKMLEFYRDVRFDECPLEEDADMLLCQWGLFDWEGEELFEFNISRQLIFDASEDDDDVWQLSLTFKFAVTAELKVLEPYNDWCNNPNELSHFEDYSKNSEAFQLIKDRTYARIGAKLEL